MKYCPSCQETKPKISFHRNKSLPDGYHTWCKVCRKTKETHKYYKENKNLIKQKVKEYGWRKRFPEKHASYEGTRRARKLSATPSWLTSEQKAHMKRTYKLRDFISKETGIPYHVDHIVPLKGKNICGLHVPWNLRVIPAIDNLSKHNNFNEGGLITTYGG